MKSNYLKLLILICVLASFGIEASSPPAPSATTSTITEIPSNVRSYYALQLWFQGFEYDTYEEVGDWIIVYGPFYSFEVVSADHKLIHDTENYINVSLGVYIKPFSYSSWSLYGQISSSDTDNTIMFGTWLMDMEFKWADLYCPE